MLVIRGHVYKIIKHLSLEYGHHLCHRTAVKVECDQIGWESARVQERAQPQGRPLRAVRGTEASVPRSVHGMGVNAVNKGLLLRKCGNKLRTKELPQVKPRSGPGVWAGVCKSRGSEFLTG